MVVRLAFCFFAILGSAGAGEVRGVWIARDSLGSREKIRDVMQTLAANNFNTAYVLAWSQGYPLFRSEVFQRETGLLTDPQYGERDVLKEAVEEGKRAGITTIPWFEYGFVATWSGRVTGTSLGPMLDAHPDWIAKNRAGETRFPISGGGYYLWFSHTHPGAQEFLMQLMEEALTRYDVPGVQFDRARYPALDCGYDDKTRELYAAANNGAAVPENPNDAAWIKWRADQLTDFLVRAQARLKTADWRALFTNAPVPTPDGYRNFAQDPPSWVKARAHDFLSPQIYWRDLPTFQAKLELHMREYGDASRLVPGIAVDTANPQVLPDIIRAVREKSLPGVVIWYYEDLVRARAFPILKDTVFAEPAATPWR
jgi:uncharacterized lipoprotein YddW (UPF0748 family)